MEASQAMESGQLTKTAAEVYEEFFVPALFGEWASRTCDAAGAAQGQRLLDVGCGTGCVAREAARRGAAVTGLDPNEGMLAVARRLDPKVDWRDGFAEKIPFDDGRFDAVTCQFGLMFFEDRVKALAEMWRVTKPGGRLVVVTWDSLERTPGYAAMVALLERLFGEAVADGLRAPFVLGNPAEVLGLFQAAGIPGASADTQVGRARFPSIADWVHTDVKGWTLADAIDDAQYAQLQQAAQEELKGFAAADGTVNFDSPAHIVTAQKA
ncbi:methyltransferase domain-containing protein [Pelagibius marinus]|uniref:methyltransferase domain-containing protein n=1 Tax=Pelagibius marinus TaxID=2762760 RepID=UPI001872E627|nr:methyltransferase domain-containing protein [Pelagibius marinus]